MFRSHLENTSLSLSEVDDLILKSRLNLNYKKGKKGINKIAGRVECIIELVCCCCCRYTVKTRRNRR